MLVENAFVSDYELPVKFIRQIGSQINADTGNNIAGPNSTPASKKESAEMIGITWQGNPLTIVLKKPDGNILYADGTSPDVVHIKGYNYEYYFLKNPGIGSWSVGVKPLSRTVGGEKFTLVTGQVSGAIPTNPARVQD
jgi:hypothetical protein